jgi:DNA-binding winged helix-turn-helix (wHTH) protein
LIEANGSIVSREELLKEVWGFRFMPKTRTTD